MKVWITEVETRAGEGWPGGEARVPAQGLNVRLRSGRDADESRESSAARLLCQGHRSTLPTCTFPCPCLVLPPSSARSVSEALHLMSLGNDACEGSVSQVLSKQHCARGLPLAADAMPSSLCLSVSTDGVFGRCQKGPAMDAHRYDVSPGALLHLRLTLQKLSRAGRWSATSCPALHAVLGAGLLVSTGGLHGPRHEGSVWSVGTRVRSSGLLCARSNHRTRSNPP